MTSPEPPASALATSSPAAPPPPRDAHAGDAPPTAVTPTVAELQAALDRAEHALNAVKRLAFLMRELVPRAFEEGFRRRLPEREEPWLVDWLQSDAKRVYDAAGGQRPGDDS